MSFLNNKDKQSLTFNDKHKFYFRDIHKTPFLLVINKTEDSVKKKVCLL